MISQVDAQKMKKALWHWQDWMRCTCPTAMCPRAESALDAVGELVEDGLLPELPPIENCMEGD